MVKKKKGFTLIELVAVLVIMAIIALMVTPLVMSIIRKARISADKRSIDAYGRSIELAIASHLLDTGKFATSIDELTIEYSGDTVTCETTQINSDSSVYLSGCKVNNRDVANYTYGTDKSPSYESYQVGDHVSYNGVNYYVIEDSDTKNNVVKLLKEEPLKPSDLEGITFDAFTLGEQNGYTTVAYGTSADYNTSYIKQVVDAWKNMSVKSSDTVTTRLISFDDLIDNLGYELIVENTSKSYKRTEISPDWVSIQNVWYWTMSIPEDDIANIYIIHYIGGLSYNSISLSNMIRPVVELYKTATITKLES